MPKISKLTPKEAHHIWQYLMLAGDNVLYAILTFWEAYQKELTAEHDRETMEEEMEILRSELYYHRGKSRSESKKVGHR